MIFVKRKGMIISECLCATIMVFSFLGISYCSLKQAIHQRDVAIRLEAVAREEMLEERQRWLEKRAKPS
jgi:hypothetical protein